MRVLVVEDDPVNAELLDAVLRRAGFDGQIARSGTEAIEVLLGDAGNSEFDMLLLDIQLPGIGGLDVARMVRESTEHREIPIVAISACATMQDRLRAEDVGIDRYLTKPVRPGHLIRVVQEMMRSRAPGTNDGGLVSSTQASGIAV